MQRLDPASLPPAGRRSIHDSANEDYRYVAARHSSPKKLQTSQWAGPSDSYLARKPEPLRPPPSTRPPPNKPDHVFCLSDVPGAQPSPFPGLSVHVPTGPSLSEPPSPARPWATTATAAATPATGMPHRSGSSSPMRATNPLSPTYVWPTQPGAGKPYPMGPSPDAMREGRRASTTQRVDHLDTSNLQGAQPSTTMRVRKAQYSSLDYSDVTGPSSPTRARWLREGREQLPPHDPRQLGLWGTCGDTGHMLALHRSQPLEPLSHGHIGHGSHAAAAQPHTTHAARTRPTAVAAGGAAEGVSSSERQAVGLPHRPAPVSIVDAMQGLGRISNQNTRSPQRFGHGHNFSQLHVRRPHEVQPLQL